MKTGILFVCLGNICRSPLAEGIMRHLVAAQGLADIFEIESAGTGNWHVGNPPDRRAVAVARDHKVDISPLRARQIRPGDLDRFDYVFAMDRDNLADLQALAKGRRTEPVLFLEFAGIKGLQDVPDPYFGGDDGFPAVFQMIENGCAAILTRVAGAK